MKFLPTKVLTTSASTSWQQVDLSSYIADSLASVALLRIKNTKTYIESGYATPKFGIRALSSTGINYQDFPFDTQISIIVKLTNRVFELYKDKSEIVIELLGYDVSNIVAFPNYAIKTISGNDQQAVCSLSTESGSDTALVAIAMYGAHSGNSLIINSSTALYPKPWGGSLIQLNTVEQFSAFTYYPYSSVWVLGYYKSKFTPLVRKGTCNGTSWEAIQVDTSTKPTAALINFYKNNFNEGYYGARVKGSAEESIMKFPLSAFAIVPVSPDGYIELYGSYGVSWYMIGLEYADTLSSSDISFHYSGGASNFNPALSINNTQSSVKIPTGQYNSIFDNVSSTEATSGSIEYRKIFIKNNHDTLPLYSAKIWIDSNTPGDDFIYIGVEPDEEAVSIANTTTAPVGISFYAAANKTNALSLGDINPLSSKKLWIKREVPADASSIANNSFSLKVEGTV